MTKLKPCPFCGEEAFLTTDDSSETGWWFTVDCSNNKCLMSSRSVWGDGSCVSTGWRRTEREAIEAWNRRSVDYDKLLKIADDLENLDIDSDYFPHWNTDIANIIKKALKVGSY